MHFVVQNRSSNTALTPTVVAAIVSALETQLTRDLAPAWGLEPPCVHDEADDTAPTDAWPIVLLDDADQAQALGYHDVDPNGLPYSRVFVATILAAGGTLLNGPLSVSTVASHEACETAVDRWANCWVDRGDGQTETALEVCDPCEDQSYDVTVEESHSVIVSVSNFVGPAWFDVEDQSGKVDQNGALPGPFATSSGGYTIDRPIGQPGAPSARGGRAAEVMQESPPGRWADKRKAGARTLARFDPRTNRARRRRGTPRAKVAVP